MMLLHGRQPASGIPPSPQVPFLRQIAGRAVVGTKPVGQAKVAVAPGRRSKASPGGAIETDMLAGGVMAGQLSLPATHSPPAPRNLFWAAHRSNGVVTRRLMAAIWSPDGAWSGRGDGVWVGVGGWVWKMNREIGH